MSALRWWAKKIGKDNLIRRDNASYGIGNRKYVTNVSKAKVIPVAQYAKVTDAYTFASLHLQETFGLRREESIKIQPRWADLGDKLRLKSSWTKGGKYREVPITTPEQRAALRPYPPRAADRLGVPCLGRVDFQAAEPGTKESGSGSTTDHFRRTWPRARTNHRSVSRALASKKKK
jgi:hypothetical protein